MVMEIMRLGNYLFVMWANGKVVKCKYTIENLRALKKMANVDYVVGQIGKGEC